MNARQKKLLAVSILLVSSFFFCRLFAIENIGSKPARHKINSVLSTGCAQDAGAAIMALNNVRCRLMDEGDMWWDPSTNAPYYFVPAAGDVCAQFAAALWIGGLDAGGELHEAAMTYRQNGEDFWAGPMYCGGTISPAECLQWDKLFYVTRAEVSEFVNNGDYSHPPPDIANWPGNNVCSQYTNPCQLAPFVDVVGNGVYDPTAGDYPAFDIGKGVSSVCSGAVSCSYSDELFGDACYWWVINDVGNVHTETNAPQIGIEIRIEAFGYKTNDAVNNMTFYNYTVINRSPFTLYKTYFGFWNDFDLGNGDDNLVGCDVTRSMGFGYAGACYDADGTGQYATERGYHDDPAAIGDVFFRGPKADAKDQGCYIKGGYIGMAKFVYYKNDFTVQGNPQNQSSYYNYLRAIWIDGTAMTYGGDGYQSSNVPCSYMYPWIPAGGALNPTQAYNTDPGWCGTGGVTETEWDCVQSKVPANDMRLLQSAGPFTLGSGAVNNVIVGCVWDQPSQNGLCNIYPIGLIESDADEAQALFNNCFKVLSGPDAPDVYIQELKNELILTLSNAVGSNNYNESYNAVDPAITNSDDTSYKFQGYIIYQVIDSTVTESQLLDASRARVAAQCDIKDSVASITNFIYNSALNAVVPTQEVTGANTGVVHSFDFKTDLFGEDNQSILVDDRPYYYMVVAYAFNNYKTYYANNSAAGGQLLPFLEGSNNVKVSIGVPHIVNAESYGTIQNSVYGQGVPVTRLEGHGNGTCILQLDQNSENYILQNDTMAHPSYFPGGGPIDIKVVDPLNVINGNFILKFDTLPKHQKGVDSSSNWSLYIEGPNGLSLIGNSNNVIGYQDEQVFPQLGISIEIVDVKFPSASVNGVLGSGCSLTFDNTLDNWITFVSSSGPSVAENPPFWIRSGTLIDQETPDMYYSSYPGPFAPPTYKYNKVNIKDSVTTILRDTTTYYGSHNYYIYQTDSVVVSNPDTIYYVRDSIYHNDSLTIKLVKITSSFSVVTNTVSIDVYYDPEQFYNNILSGTWSPFDLCAVSDPGRCTTCSPYQILYVDFGPGYKIQTADSIANIANVDIVFAGPNEMQNWTRCVVFEMGDQTALSIGGTPKFGIRKSNSINQSGVFASAGMVAEYNDPSQPNYISPTGMGWFPGYAINVETGERLNMAYGEDSWLCKNNGHLMQWWLDSTVTENNGTGSDGASQFFGKTSIFGGKHYIYVFGHNYNVGGHNYSIPVYDKDSTLLANYSLSSLYEQFMLNDIIWVSMPMLTPGHSMFECDATVKLRVALPYDTNYGSTYVHGKASTNFPSRWGNPNPSNGNRPMYSFSTNGLGVDTSNHSAAVNALALINVVPNPYYAYSEYESDRLDTRVRITNLPPICTISIFSINGTLVNVINKNNPSTYTDWTLQNQYNVPIASGLYLIHVAVPNVGEVTLKWFGVMRPIDLGSY